MRRVCICDDVLYHDVNVQCRRSVRTELHALRKRLLRRVTHPHRRMHCIHTGVARQAHAWLNIQVRMCAVRLKYIICIYIYIY